jgi:DNA-binding transcriptional LysR family regulator
MNLRHLQTFVAIADGGGVTSAAVRLNLTQPTASRQIHALESELGVTLFERVGRVLKLTSEGEDLLQRSRRLLADATAMGERARALKSGETGVLRIGAAPLVIERILPDFLVQYRRRHPGVEVRIVEDGGARLPTRIERGDVHLAIMPEGDERFSGRLLCPNLLLAVTSKKHAWRRRALLEITDLSDQPLLLHSRGFGNREWFTAACQVAHVKPHVAMESISPQTLVALAAGGDAVAIVPAGVLLPREKVHAMPLVHRSVPVGRWRMIAWHGERYLPPYAHWFVDEMVVHTRDNYPNRDLIRRAPPLPRPKEPPR